MTTVIKYEVKGVQELVNKLDNAVKDDVVKGGLNTAAKNIAFWVANRKLSGRPPGALNVVSGRLRSSITFSLAEKSGNTYFSKVGTNVDYAPAHEFGFFGRVLVGPHFRKQFRKARLFGRTKNRLRIGDGFVNAHYRNMNIPKRPFLAPAFEDQENQQMVVNVLSQKINEALSK